MQPFITALHVSAGICVSIGMLAGVAWSRRRDLTHYGLFAVMATLAGLKTFVEPAFYQATTVEAHVRGLWWQIFLIILFLAAFAWFLRAYTGVARRWLVWLITGVLAVDLVIHLRSPFTILYREISALDIARLPWGETLAVAQGTPSSFRVLVEAPGALLALLVLDAAVRMWRQGSRRKVAVLVGAYVPFLVLFSLWGPMVDLGLVRAPYLGTFGFLIFVIVIGSNLADDVARASMLAGAVEARDQRWRAFFSEAHTAMVRLDASGIIERVNPHLLRITGFDAEELEGAHLRVLLPDRDRKGGEDRFERLMSGQGEPVIVGRIRTRNDTERTILWSRVPLRTAEGTAQGMIAVGSDITDRLEAESERDRAIRELEALKAQLEEENVYLRQEIHTTHGFDEMIGDSPALRYVLHRVEQVAGTDTTVVIEGETGVGKELVARAIHMRSDRSDRPFVRVNCAALPANLIESELFGHEKGAFTGAYSTRRGRFEIADGGTLLLDEVAELPLDLQAKLLRVLQEGEFERVGSSTTRNSDARIIASTNRSLSDEVAAGRFREDLFYRLHVYPITVPPLRERAEDIPLLVSAFARRLGERSGRSVTEVPPAVMRSLQEYRWPGNVRELENVIERSVILSDGPVLVVPPGLLTRATGAQHGTASDGGNREAGTPVFGPNATLAAVERAHIRAVLRSTGGRVSGSGGAAEILGMHPNTLRSRMKKLQIVAAPKGSPAS
jgi:PAS domain S-box-containing protein